MNAKFPTINIICEEGHTDLNIESDWLVTEFDYEFLKHKCPDELLDVEDIEMVVWVDPLDGTSEYTQGFLEHVTVMIGVAVKNLAIAGVMHQPYYKCADGKLGRTIWGLKGLGTGGYKPNLPPSNEFVIATTRLHSNAVVQAALDALAPTKVLKVGGAGYKVLLLLEGKAHAYVFASTGCKKWDTCAPEAILEAQGGVLTDIFGNHYTYDLQAEYLNKRGVLATSTRAFHADILQKLPTVVLEAMNANP